MLFSICSSRVLNFLSFCNFAFRRITVLLTELYRFNPKPAPTLICGSERMDRIKYMATSRGSFSINTDEMSHAARQIRIRGLYHQMVMGWHQTKGGYIDREQICCFLKQIEKLLIIRFFLKKLFPPSLRARFITWCQALG